jgi:hypothetical protein
MEHHPTWSHTSSSRHVLQLIASHRRRQLDLSRFYSPIDPLRSCMVAYSWEKGSLAKPFQPKCAALFNRRSSTTFGYSSRFRLVGLAKILVFPWQRPAQGDTNFGHGTAKRTFFRRIDKKIATARTACSLSAGSQSRRSLLQVQKGTDAASASREEPVRAGWRN